MKVVSRIAGIVLVGSAIGCSGGGGGKGGGGPLDAGWGEPTALGAYDPAGWFKPGIDALGNAVVLSGDTVFTRPGDEWVSETLPYFPRMLEVGDERGILLGTSDAVSEELHARVFEAGVLLPDEVLVTSTSDDWTYVPVITSTGIATVWAEGFDSYGIISIRLWSATEGWQPRVSFTYTPPEPADWVYFPTELFAASRPDGSILVVWEEMNDFNNGSLREAAWGTEFVDGQWREPVPLAEYGALGIASLPDGRVIAMVRDSSAPDPAASASLFVPESGWEAPEILVGMRAASGLVVRADAAGQATVLSGVFGLGDKRFARFDGIAWGDVVEPSLDTSDAVSFITRGEGDGFAFAENIDERGLLRPAVFPFDGEEFGPPEFVGSAADDLYVPMNGADLRDSGRGVVAWAAADDGEPRQVWISVR